MMKTKVMAKFILYAISFLFVAVPSVGYGATAEVLPKRVFDLGTTYYHYFDIHKRYNQDGKAEDLAADFNKDLTSQVFSALSALDPFVGGRANLGRSVVDFTLIYRWWEFTLAYGLTDRLTLGVLVPYNYSKNDVSASLDSSNANVGKNSFLNSLAPLSVPGTQRLTTDDIQDLLGQGLDINKDGTTDVQGYGYKRVKTWSDNGIGDIELLGKYQLYKSDHWRLAAVGGVRLPTGEVDDIDNLVDVPFGDGQTDIILRFHGDYLGIKNLCLNGTVRYDIQLPDEEKKRIPSSVDRPVTADKETVDRDLGDIVELEFMGSYSFTKYLFGGLKYRFTKKFKDDVDGDMGFAYSSLEDETNFKGHMGFAFLGFNTTQMYFDKTFPVPLIFKVEYRNRFDGKNNATKSEYLSLSLDVFF
jgi:hypothetical protein